MCFSLRAQDTRVSPDTLADKGPLYFPTDTGFVYLFPELGKVVFAQLDLDRTTPADSLIDLNARTGRLVDFSEEDTNYYIYTLVDAEEVFDPARARHYPEQRNLYYPDVVVKREVDYDDYIYNTTSRPVWENRKTLNLSWVPFNMHYRHGKETSSVAFDYQFSVWGDQFVFYTANSNRLVIYNQLGEAQTYSTLRVTEPFFYSRKHQSIHYDEVQQNYYLLIRTNIGYNWYQVDPESGETELVHQIKQLWKDPNWFINDGTLYYTKEVSGEATVFQTPLL